jgi:hypothetical protein
LLFARNAQRIRSVSVLIAHAGAVRTVTTAPQQLFFGRDAIECASCAVRSFGRPTASY